MLAFVEAQQSEEPVEAGIHDFFRPDQKVLLKRCLHVLFRDEAIEVKVK